MRVRKEEDMNTRFFITALIFLALSIISGILKGFENPVALTYQLVFWVLFAASHIIEVIEKKGAE